MFDFRSALSEVLKYCGKDHEEIAEAIAERCNSFSELAELDINVLSPICGEKYAVMLRLLAAIESRRITDSFKFGRKYSEDEVRAFLRGYFFDSVNETVVALPIDSRGCVTACDVLIEGTVNFSGLIPRKLLEIMMKRNCDKVILAHNHPNGKASASVEDMETTFVIKRLLESVNKTLVCHYIVAGDEILCIDPASSDRIG